MPGAGQSSSHLSYRKVKRQYPRPSQYFVAHNKVCRVRGRVPCVPDKPRKNNKTPISGHSQQFAVLSSRAETTWFFGSGVAVAKIYVHQELIVPRIMNGSPQNSFKKLFLPQFRKLKHPKYKMEKLVPHYELEGFNFYEDRKE